MDLLLAKVVRMEADSDRPVKPLWRTRSSAITTRLSRRAQRQQGRVHHTLTLEANVSLRLHRERPTNVVDATFSYLP
jgi:hypothetical protein